MITVTWGVRRWLWCDACGQVAVLHQGDVCLRCIARMDAEHPELHDLDDVARELGVSLTGCETCDDQRPALPTTADDARDLHRAAHALGRALAADLEHLIAAIRRRIFSRR